MIGSRRFFGAWLGLAVSLTMATQLRVGPLGPGELLLAGWLLASGLVVLLSGRLRITPASRPLLAFWMTAFVLLLAGWLFALLTDHATEGAIHDFVAFCLVATLVALVGLKPGGWDELRTAVVVAIFVSTGALFLLLAATFPFGTIGPIEAWNGPRFRGWSSNPNQVALAMSAIPFIAIFKLRGELSTPARAAYLLLLLGALLVGVACASDGLRLGWITGTVLMVTCGWLLGMRRGHRSLFRGALYSVIAPAAVVGVTAFVGVPLYLRLTAAFDTIYRTGGQGSERVTLWRHGVDAIAASPLFGFGPGAHSGHDGPFEGFEAHNTLIDWATATGVPGAFLLMLLLGWVAYRAIASPALLGALAAVTVLSITGYNLRHPTLWAYVLFVAVAGREVHRGARGDGAGDGGRGPVSPGAAAGTPALRNS